MLTEEERKQRQQFSDRLGRHLDEAIEEVERERRRVAAVRLRREFKVIEGGG